MKLVQLNMWGGRLVKLIFKFLEDEQPDIVCLQEAISLPGGDNGGFFLTVEIIAKELGYHVSFSPAIGFQFMDRTAEFGNAILSKLPFESQQTIFTRKAYMKDFDFAHDDYNIRNLQYTTIGTKAGTIHVLTHHGHHVPEHKNGNDETMRQCKLIADYVTAIDGNVILTGDFNLAPHSASLELINARLTNLSLEKHLTTTRTPLTHKTEVCDYIFVSDSIAVSSFYASDEIVSDHKALILEFEL